MRYSIGVWFYNLEFIAIWSQGIALVAIFIWGQIASGFARLINMKVCPSRGNNDFVDPAKAVAMNAPLFEESCSTGAPKEISGQGVFKTATKLLQISACATFTKSSARSTA